MNRVELKHISLRPSNPLASWQPGLHRLLFFLFLADALLVWVRLCGATNGPRVSDWPDVLLLVLSLATTLSSLSRDLPAQNAILASVVIGLAASAAGMLDATTGIPFGPIVYDRFKSGRLLCDVLPWTVPLIWVVIILNSRGVARLILYSHRPRSHFGFWLMGLTVLLAVLLESSLQPYAVLVKQYWSWKPTRLPSDWYTCPWTDFLGWALATGLMLLFVTPSLINKRPVQSAPRFHALVVWETLSLLFLTGTSLQHLWGAVSLIAAQMIVVAILCARIKSRATK